MSGASLRGFRPGLYSTFAPNKDESFNGYLLRLASDNHLPGIKGLIKVLNANLDTRYKSTTEIRIDERALGELGAMGMGNQAALLPYLAKPLGGDAHFINGCRIDGDAALTYFAQLCPQCLAERGFAEAAWDYAPVVACAIHRTTLVDSCSRCNTRLSWERLHLFHCGACGHDLRSIDAIPAVAAVVEVSEDFAALAPFRLLYQNGQAEKVLWDTAFRLLKSCALDIAHWCVNDYPKGKFFNHLTHGRRHDAVTALAHARTWRGYRLRRIGPALKAKLSHLSQVPGSFVVENYVTQFLLTQAAVSYQVASAITYENPPPEKTAAAHLFSGRPPPLRSPEEISGFLGCDMTTVKGLYATGRVAAPGESALGHDIDELVDAARFLKEDLLGLPELCQLLGVALDWDDLRRNRVMARWNPKSETDYRVSVSDAVHTQNRLCLVIDTLSLPHSPVRLGALAAGSLRPCLTVLSGASLLLAGGLRYAAWPGPHHAWADIQIDESEAQLILSGRKFANSSVDAS